MLFMSTASGSRVGFHIYCHFLVAVEVAVEVAVAFQSGSRKESGSRKVNDLFSVIKSSLSQHQCTIARFLSSGFFGGSVLCK